MRRPGARAQITHDTGGYNLKVGASIESMKCDMGGAAAAFGAARAIGAIKPPGVEVSRRPGPSVRQSREG